MAITRADINHTFDAADMAVLMDYGTREAHAAGDVLVAEGQKDADMIVLLSGQADILLMSDTGERRLGWMEPGQFAGDVSVLTGQRSLVRLEMVQAGEILRIAHADFQRLLVTHSRLSDIFVRVLTARREFGVANASAAIIVIGAAFDRAVFAVRDLLAKHNFPHVWIDPDREADRAATLLADRSIDRAQLPVVILGEHTVLTRPTTTELAAELGLDMLPDGATADVVVVGAGPAGLAASVYAASEGLTVLTLDSFAPGGQAGTSSKIENYLGFPTGVSGRELAQRAAIQAQKFGARLVAPVTVDALARDGDAYCLSLGDGRHVRSRAVVIASGAQYQRLPIADMASYEGRGIYYGATPMEAQLCGDAEVAVVGAGNSAGQGAIYLAATAKTVHVVYRRPDIRETMSEYLVRRLEDTPNIILHPSSEVIALHGVGEGDALRLAEVTFHNSATNSRRPGRLSVPVPVSRRRPAHQMAAARNGLRCQGLRQDRRRHPPGRIGPRQLDARSHADPLRNQLAARLCGRRRPAGIGQARRLGGWRRLGRRQRHPRRAGGRPLSAPIAAQLSRSRKSA